ncbi:MAG TPA: hypothetical protein VFS05_16345, partial [Gemmatimonadaceae bacterium]|nr:hypothetical protein [Gemmatimonadaceae bacterium]
MRTLLAALLALALLEAPAALHPRALPAQASAADADSIHAAIRSARERGELGKATEGKFRSGPRTVAAGERVAGSAVTVRGDLDVFGRIDGDAVAIFGDVIVHPGAVVTGDAVAVLGTVRREGGTVGGEVVSLSRQPTPARTTGERMAHGLSLATGWMIVLAVIGVAVLFLARRNLERIADAIGTSFTRALAWGLVAQLALFPVMMLIIVALVVTILGILLIPFAIVAYFTAAAGAIALGFLAMAYVAGESVGRRIGGEGLVSSGIATLAIGILLFYVAWLLPVVTASSAVLSVALRIFAGAVTWAALTVGFGAALLTRGGTREAAGALPPAPPAPEDDYSWQTPTPVTGVVAARRPTP